MSDADTVPIWLDVDTGVAQYAFSSRGAKAENI